MKDTFMKNTFLNYFLFLKRSFVGISLLSSFFFSCNSDKVSDEFVYTFVGETVYSYCKEQSDYTIFTRLMEDSGTDKLLSCYGHFTCFIPNDSAFQVYFDDKRITYDSLTTEEKRSMVYDHVISNKETEYLSESFEQGALPTYNMSNDQMTISFAGSTGDSQIIYVGGGSRIIQKDNEVHNGVVHLIDKVIVPSALYFTEVLKQDSTFALFSEALEMTRLGDSLRLVEDLDYVQLPEATFIFLCDYPKYKKYGYTVFAETDSIFALPNEVLSGGIHSVSDLIKYAEYYYGTEDANDFTSRDNALNKFVSYHILDRSLSTNSMVYNGLCTAPDYQESSSEYYETFLKYRLMEVKSSANKINQRKDGSFVAMDDSKCNIKAINGYLHALKNILVYDEDLMQNDVLNKRLRFDFTSVAPPFTNDNMRWNTHNSPYWVFPDDFFGDKIRLNTDGGCKMVLFGSDYWYQYEGDIFAVTGSWCDITLKTIPVPPGTYEVRFGYVTDDGQPVAQFFFDENVVGIPVDLSMRGADGQDIVGWELDANTDDEGIANDKMMRNLGYMKGPSSILVEGGTSQQRDHSNCLRIILGTFTFQQYGSHTFRLRNVEEASRAVGLDYLEFVPKGYLRVEGKD